MAIPQTFQFVGGSRHSSPEKDAGQFATGAFCISASCIIFLLFRLGRIQQLPAILAIVGQVIMGLSLIVYLCFFHTPKSFWSSDSEDEDDL